MLETTTLGVRRHTVQRTVLARAAGTGAGGVRVKRARRPDGSVTRKAEMADLAATRTHAARECRRRSAHDADAQED